MLVIQILGLEKEENCFRFIQIPVTSYWKNCYRDNFLICGYIFLITQIDNLCS